MASLSKATPCVYPVAGFVQPSWQAGNLTAASSRIENICPLKYLTFNVLMAKSPLQISDGQSCAMIFSSDLVGFRAATIGTTTVRIGTL